VAVIVPWMSLAPGLADGERLTGGPCGALPEVVSRDDDRTRRVGDAAWMRRLQLLSCTRRAQTTDALTPGRGAEAPGRSPRAARGLS